MEDFIPESIRKEQMRQEERKRNKKLKSLQKKKPNTDIISVAEYKKLKNDSALKKAEERAWEWFSLSIRLRDIIIVNDKLYWLCIACNKKEEIQFYSDRSIVNAKLWNSSHYFRKDLYGSIKFDRINNNLSCYNCNRNLGGNLNLYKINLIKKVGEQEFKNMEARRHKPKNLNIIELTKIKEESMDLVKKQAVRLKIKYY